MHSTTTIDTAPIAVALQARTDLCAAWLLGSAARDALRPDSDIDIALLPRPGATLDFQRQAELTAELCALLHRPVDLGVVSSRNLVYARQAILTGRPIFKNPGADLAAATLLGLYAQYYFERREVADAYRA